MSDIYFSIDLYLSSYLSIISVPACVRVRVRYPADDHPEHADQVHPAQRRPTQEHTHTSGFD